MKKGIIALALTFGFAYVQAQDTQNQNNEYFECVRVQPDDIQSSLDQGQEMDQQGTTQDTTFNLGEEPSARAGEQQFESETEIKSETEKECPMPGDARMESEQQFEGETEIQQEGQLNDQSMDTQSDIYYEGDSNLNTQGDADLNTDYETDVNVERDYQLEDGTSMYYEEDLNRGEKLNDVSIYQYEEERGSTFGNIIKAPFKAAGSIISETAEGVGHIVGAPFKGVARLFGRDQKNNVNLENVDIEGKDIMVEERALLDD